MTRSRRISRLGILPLLPLMLGLAAAQPLAQSSDEPELPTLVHTDPDDDRRTMLFNPRGYPLYSDLGFDPHIQPEITVERRGDLGFDIVYRFRNETDETVTLGRFGVGIITLGSRLTWLHHARGFEFRTEDRRDLRTQVTHYPHQAYSPVAVLSNERFAVGVSLLYDVMNDRHGTRIGIRSVDGRYTLGPGGPGYAVTFNLAQAEPDTSNDIHHPAQLRAGEQRTYTVAVRAAELPQPADSLGTQHWLETIEPYREHFRRTHGSVAYERDGRALNKYIAGNTDARGPGNPNGFTGGERGRPDLVGWGPTADRVLENTTYAATVIWAPTGLNDRHRSLDFPSRFTSRWLESDPLMTAFDASDGLASIPSRGGSFGLWWGRAAEYTPYWDAPTSEPLDLNRSEHRAFAERELGLAVQAGASRVGLDAFTHARMPVWEQAAWIGDIRERHPDLRVTIEPMPSDVMHAAAAGYLKAWQIVPGTSPDRFFRVDRPHALADYLLPGHETWAYFRYGDIRDLPGGSDSPERIQQDAAYLASMGYTPMLNTRVPLTDPSGAVAAESWALTVPEYLKTPDHASGHGGTTGGGDDGSGGRDGPGAGDSGGDEASGERGSNGRRGLTLPNGRIIWFGDDED